MVARRAQHSTPLALLSLLAAAGCSETTPPSDNTDRVTIVTDQGDLSKGVTSKDDPVDVEPAAALPNGRIVAVDLAYDLTLVAEVEAPVVDGVTLQATSVAFQDSIAVVAYNVAGETQKGAIDVFVFDESRRPTLTSRATFSDTDVNTAGAAVGRVYLATATSDETLGTPAVIEALGLEKDGTLSMRGHFRTGLASYGVTGVAYDRGHLYATSGDRGGVFALDAASGEVVAQSTLDDARWIDCPGDERVVAVRGTPGQLVVYSAGNLAPVAEYPFDGANVPESKSTVEVAGGKAFVAAGAAGTFVIDLASGKQLAQIPIPAAYGHVDADTVTNAVSVDGDLVFISNGSGGVYLVASSEPLAAPSNPDAPPLFQLMGRLVFPDEASASVNHITYKDGFLFVASGRGGLKIVRVDQRCASLEIPKNGKDDDCDGEVDESLDAAGCADGAREGFDDTEQWPDIAACAGAWQVGGVLSSTREPACGKRGGDDGRNAAGLGCNVADLCADGWHVCEGANDVAQSSTTGCVGADDSGKQFFATRQSGSGCGVCAMGTSTLGGCADALSCTEGCAQTDELGNDVFGCGTLGPAPYADCGPLDAFTNDGCAALPAPWSCEGGTSEAATLVKSAPAFGGVLCCRDR